MLSVSTKRYFWEFITYLFEKYSLIDWLRWGVVVREWNHSTCNSAGLLSTFRFLEPTIWPMTKKSQEISGRGERHPWDVLSAVTKSNLLKMIGFVFLVISIFYPIQAASWILISLDWFLRLRRIFIRFQFNWYCPSIPRLLLWWFETRFYGRK